MSRLLAYGVGALAVLAAVFWLCRTIYQAGDKSGSARIQVAWDADKASIAKTAADALADANRRTQDALEANQVIHDQYEAKLQNTSADAAAFAARLRRAEASLAAGPSSVSQGANKPGSATAGAPSSAGQLGQLVALVTDLRSECIANNAQLNALIAEVKPQL